MVSVRSALAFAAILGLIASVGCRRHHHASELRVAAASSLTHVFAELGTSYEKHSGRKVVFSFGSSGKLASQIENGAPFDLFASASAHDVDRLIERGAVRPETRTSYALGRVALWSPRTPLASLEGLRSHQFVRIAIAQPEHAPYGLAAKQALQRSGYWQSVEERLVFHSNVRGAMQWAESGNAEAAFTSASLAIQHGDFLLIDSSLHDPLEQVAVLCKGAALEHSRSFLRFLQSPTAAVILAKHGFETHTQQNQRQRNTM